MYAHLGKWRTHARKESVCPFRDAGQCHLPASDAHLLYRQPWEPDAKGERRPRIRIEGVF
jgi:hypothetical protein